MERLQKVIARGGIASRRHAEELIQEGRVTVNGTIVTTLGLKVDPAKDHIKVDGKRIQIETKKIYLLLNKPKGYITSVRDPEGRPTVMELVPKGKERLYPVGRLDFYTEGLLLLTNDGNLAHQLMHPRFEIEKRYWAKVKGIPTEDQIKKIERGGILLPPERETSRVGSVGTARDSSPVKSAPCKISSLPQGKEVENRWLELVLHEGKKREVRRLMEKIGHPVLKLKRVGFANLNLGTVPTGSYRLLSPKEIEGLQKLVERKKNKSTDSPP